MDLYGKGIQPVWVKAENRGNNELILTQISLDQAYFTARETANRSRIEFSLGHAAHFEERSHARLTVSPQSIAAGYIFSRLD